MEDSIDALIEHVSHTNRQLARVLEAERHVVVRTAQMIHALPDENPELGGFTGLIDQASGVTRSVIAYLNSIADLQEMMAEQLYHVMIEMDDNDE
ncbi:nucleoside-diphosphate sugar epimerase [Paenibacillus xylaniclasticus]|uniref:nucleoside-diphosphate sugar epimerase n=1 Tax=Paenibacillus xylaniclasticus TaxID=588083 RepID=UPI000FD7647B|nr:MULTISPECIES: nucleoside-diphosphate sugar epimerase [Paenibacillus]GFN31008.1 hypothetical protein PCURB6_12680 [Paenibacillus curdlanolyticus]